MTREELRLQVNALADDAKDFGIDDAARVLSVLAVCLVRNEAMPTLVEAVNAGYRQAQDGLSRSSSQAA